MEAGPWVERDPGRITEAQEKWETRPRNVTGIFSCCLGPAASRLYSSVHLPPCMSSPCTVSVACVASAGCRLSSGDLGPSVLWFRLCCLDQGYCGLEPRTQFVSLPFGFGFGHQNPPRT